MNRKPERWFQGKSFTSYFLFSVIFRDALILHSLNLYLVLNPEMITESPDVVLNLCDSLSHACQSHQACLLVREAPGNQTCMPGRSEEIICLANLQFGTMCEKKNQFLREKPVRRDAKREEGIERHRRDSPHIFLSLSLYIIEQM